uniref:J domain-containing protein n=1 Tax=Kalanchoe fedtschenkoi TaxID=63787 RepID=A0A7N0V1H1_KALFE
MRIFLLVSPSPSRLAVQSRRCCCCWTMNRTALKSALLGSNSGAVHFSAALFHSTPYLHRKSSRWDSSWQSDFDEDESPSWFRKQYGHKGSRKGRIKNQKPGFSGRRGFQFCNDDVDVESLFRAAFGGKKSHFWSFTADEIPQWRRGPSDFGINHDRNTWRWRTRWQDDYASGRGTSWNSRHEDEDDSSAELDGVDSSCSSDRVALGLSASGPLKLGEIKKAYRQCALKWHPDRHQGSSKAAAEENFKKCSAAYESLCSKMSEA